MGKTNMKERCDHIVTAQMLAGFKPTARVSPLKSKFRRGDRTCIDSILLQREDKPECYVAECISKWNPPPPSHRAPKEN